MSIPHSPISRRSKYGVRTDPLGKAARTADGILFASQRECERYLELRLLERNGIIRDLKIQPRFPLYACAQTPEIDFEFIAVNVCDYVADFQYYDSRQDHRRLPPADWILVTEDVKGVKTEIYKLKAKWFRACYGREIRET